MRILVAEDEPVVAVLLRGMLARMGHEVVVAGDGLDAWERLQFGDFRLVITDWMMPRLDGLELCRRIRAQVGIPYIYIILLTAREGREDRLRGLDSGADDILTKKPDLAELTVRLRIAERILAMQAQLEETNAQLKALAVTDALTGLGNRRELDAALRTSFLLALRSGLALSVVMVDVDHFKDYNDTYGHLSGDEVLRRVADLLHSNSRGHDILGRYGGEEFLAVLPGTDAEGALGFAERMRRCLEEHSWPHCPITASFGVATLSAAARDEEVLLDQADQALYHAKRSGRNRVTHHRNLEFVIDPDTGVTSRGLARHSHGG